MRQLFRLEITKSLRYNPFRIIIFLHLLFFLLGLFAIPRIDINFPFLSIIPLYQFPHVWNFITFIAGIYNITLVVLMIMMTSLEFSNHTYKHQIIFGLSRTDLFKQKLILAFLISLYVVVLIFITTMISGLVYSYKLTFSIAFERSWLLLNTFLQTFTFLAMGILFALIFKNMILSVLVFGFYRVFLEPIVRSLVEQEYRWFFPSKFITRLTPEPQFFDIIEQKMQQSEGFTKNELTGFNKAIPEGVPIGQNVLLTMIFLGLILYASWLILKKRNLN